MTASQPEASKLKLEKYKKNLELVSLNKDVGKVTRIVGALMEGYLPGAFIGSQCFVQSQNKPNGVLSEVVGFKDQKALLLPFEDLQGVGLRSKIVLDKQISTIKVGSALLGRVLNGLGQPIDGKGPLETSEEAQIYKKSVNPLQRRSIEQPLDL